MPDMKAWLRGCLIGRALLCACSLRVRARHGACVSRGCGGSSAAWHACFLRCGAETAETEERVERAAVEPPPTWCAQCAAACAG